MGLIDLFLVASLPVVKVLLITALGSFLALDRFDILGKDARHHLNKVVFYVFNPCLIASNLAKTVTVESFLTLWFIPINILITFIIGSALGWLLVKVTRSPLHLKGLIIGACSSGNFGSMLLILVPAMCKEKGSPFGAVDVCETYAMSYASFSMATGAIYLWLYIYNIVRVTVEEATNANMSNNQIEESLLSSTTDYCVLTSEENQLNYSSSTSLLLRYPLIETRTKQWLTRLSEKINIKAIFAPSTIAAIVGFGFGMISPIQKLMIGVDAPLHVVTDSAYMIGNAAIPTVTIIMGANLLQGLKGSGIQLRVIVGILIARYIIMPLLGILIVKGAIHIGVVPSNDKLFVFLLLIHYTLPPAINLGTMMQLFGAGRSECSVIMLWTYTSASIFLTLWSTIFLWILT